MSTVGQTIHYMRSDGRHVYGKPTTRPVIDRITTRTQRTTYKGEGICLGAEVQGYAHRPYVREREHVTGQIWAQGAPFSSGSKGHWWIVDESGRVFYAHEDSLLTIGQADTPLFEVSA